MVPSEAQFRQRIHDLTQPFNVLRMGAEGALLAAEQGKATAEFLVERLQLIADQSDLAAGAIDSLRVMARRDLAGVLDHYQRPHLLLAGEAAVPAKVLAVSGCRIGVVTSDRLMDRMAEDPADVVVLAADAAGQISELREIDPLQPVLVIGPPFETPDDRCLAAETAEQITAALEHLLHPPA